SQVLTLILLLSSEFPPKPFCRRPGPSTPGMLGLVNAARELNSGSLLGIVFANPAIGRPVVRSNPYPSRTGTPLIVRVVAGLKISPRKIGRPNASCPTIVLVLRNSLK